MKKVAYLGMDVHAKHCVLGHMDSNGNFLGNMTFPTSEQNIIEALKAINAKEKYLAMEEGNLAYWVAQVSKPYVAEVISSDPKENALIFRSSRKADKVDTRKLCRLLRLGELKRVYQPENDDRAIFKAAVQHYMDLRDQQTALKHKIKAAYRHWGVVSIEGSAVYRDKRSDYLQMVKQSTIRDQLITLYSLMDEAESKKAEAFKTVKKLGQKYPEIKEFQNIPGVGGVLAHTYDAFIQTPHRFADKHKLWRYCRLGVTDRNSDGKPLGYKKLDRSGIAELKAMSYRAWLAAMKGDNEVKRFYLNSYRNTLSRVHARLNTQRKIIAVMYGMWKRGEAYSAKQFLNSSEMGVV